jgi:hypothetical protein
MYFKSTIIGQIQCQQLQKPIWAYKSRGHSESFGLPINASSEIWFGGGRNVPVLPKGFRSQDNGSLEVDTTKHDFHHSWLPLAIVTTAITT